MNIDFIRKYFQKKQINTNSLKKYFSVYQDDYRFFIQIYNLKYSEIFNFFQFVRLYIKDDINHFCKICNKQLNAQQIHNKTVYCSKQCFNKDLDFILQKKRKTCLQKFGCQCSFQSDKVKDKIKETNVKKYGVQNAAKNDSIKQKIKKTCLQKYGRQYYFQTQDKKQKSKSTCLNKYGKQYACQSDVVKDKIVQSNLQKYGFSSYSKTEQHRQFMHEYYQNLNDEERKAIEIKTKNTNLQIYGVQNVFQSQLIKQKIKKYNLQKYGVQHNMQRKDVVQKARKTFLKKYNVDNPNKSKIIRQKTKKTNLQKYGVEQVSLSQQVKKKKRITYFKKLIDRISNYVIPLFDINEFNGSSYNQIYRWKCIKCGNIFQDYIHSSNFGQKSFKIPRCLKCYPYIQNVGISRQQKQIYQFISSFYYEQIDCNNKSIINPLQLDIYIPQKNIAIQFDGIYWHSCILNKNIYYHLKKTELCLQKGIQLIHIFQDDWIYKNEIVKDRLKNILGIYDKKIYARKCIIKEIDISTKNIFLNQNHLQGSDNSKIKLGLFYQDQLVSVMTFGKPRFNKNYEWQLIRFSSKLGYQIIGGAGKLLKYFERKYQPKSLISYADRRYSNGKMYYALDFQFLNNSELNYWWIKDNVKFSRYQCQKHKLKNILGQKFNPQLSEFQNMYLNGFNKIYDCGNIVFIKKY